MPLVAPLQLKGCTRTSSFCSTTAPSGGVKASSTFVLGLSTSTSRSSRRVPPPRGSPPRCPSLGVPFWLVQPFFGSSYQVTPHAEVHRLRTRLSAGSALPSSLCIFFFVPLVYPRGGWVPGQTDVFPGRGHVHLGGLLCQGQRVPCVPDSRSHLSSYFAYSRGGSSGFEGRLSFWGLWVSRWKKQSMRLTIFVTLIEPSLPTCMVFSVRDRGGACSGLSAEPRAVKFMSSPRELIT